MGFAFWHELSQGRRVANETAEISEIAQAWLLGTTLADKLAPAGPVSDARPGAPRSIAQPGRSPELALCSRGAALPSELDADADRARALHVFANHELLAIELFAWALLRWPDAPPAFRRGLLAIIAEEQDHLRGYLDRLVSLGVAFGSEPMSAFLWNALTRCDTPLQFAVGMGMGFEQANLDHARAWSARFAAANDVDSAALLSRIADDEVGHVRHGNHWFERWRDPAVPKRDAWVACFVPPLTPARARGPAFWEAGRVRAGLDPEIIELVRGFSSSKGRPPDVYWFNPGAEAHAAAGRDRGTEPRVVRELTADLAPLLGFLAGPDDVVVTPRVPSPGFLAELAETVPVPAFRTTFPDGPVRASRPWAATPDAAHRAPVRCADRQLFMRSALAEWLRERWPTVEGWIAADELPIAAADDAVAPSVIALLPHGRVVAKADFSASGRNRRWFDAPPNVPMPGSWVVERWFDRVADVSVQLTMRGGRASVDGVGRFLTDARGQYQGAVLGDPTAGLAPEVSRWLGGRLGEWMAAAVALLEPWLARLGFEGPAGIDAMIVRTPSGLKFHPIVELNPRMTMGRVALALSRRVSRAAVWWHLPVAARAWLDGLPSPEWERGRLVAGRWWTTDPTLATRTLTAVIAARHALELPEWPELDRAR
jgi:uncharacterized ferritin-like protein (DUF455 family)